VNKRVTLKHNDQSVCTIKDDDDIVYISYTIWVLARGSSEYTIWVLTQGSSDGFVDALDHVFIYQGVTVWRRRRGRRRRRRRKRKRRRRRRIYS
jgi:hypothetical protein